jgi:hypothetical protein
MGVHIVLTLICFYARVCELDKEDRVEYLVKCFFIFLLMGPMLLLSEFVFMGLMLFSLDILFMKIVAVGFNMLFMPAFTVYIYDFLADAIN